MTAIAQWGIPEWGFAEWGAGLPFGTRENGDPFDESSPLVEIPIGVLDTKQTATDRLYKQFEPNQTWQDLACIFGESFTDLENAAEQVGAERYISNAVGVQLDAIGALVNRPRGQLTDDDDYRLAILVDAASLFASGTIPEILDLCVSLLGDGVEIRDYYPANFRIRAPTIPAGRYSLLLDILRDVPPAGVGAVLSVVPPNTGGWESIHGVVTDPGAWDSIHGNPVGLNALWASGRGIG